MQWAVVLASPDVGIRLRGLVQRQRFRKRDDAQQLRPVLFQTFQVHLGERHGSDLLGLDEWRDVHHAPERQIFN